jgi:hypothetical protein
MGFTGWVGVGVGLVVLICAWMASHLATPHFESFTFDAAHEKDSFDKVLGPYLDIAKFIVGLAAGAIVLVIGSSVFGKSGSLPRAFASPLFLLTSGIIYGILFMVLLIFNYEGFRHHPQSYTRFRYVRNQALGFGALGCFCVGYAWLIVAATK